MTVANKKKEDLFETMDNEKAAVLMKEVTMKLLLTLSAKALRTLNNTDNEKERMSRDEVLDITDMMVRFHHDMR